MNLDRFHSEDWPMLPHSESESYPDDWEQIKPKTILPVPVLADALMSVNQRTRYSEARESNQNDVTPRRNTVNGVDTETLAAGIQSE